MVGHQLVTQQTPDRTMIIRPTLLAWLTLPLVAACGAPDGTASTRGGAGSGSPFAVMATEDTAFLGRASRARTFGSAEAPNVIYEVTDYSCPTCMRFYVQKADSLKSQLVATGEAQLVHVASPLPQLLRSWQGASAAFCVAGLAGQEAYLRMQDELFSQQEDWRHLGDPLPMLAGMAERSGVAANDLTECVRQNRVAPLILSDLRTVSQLRAQGLEIPGTPTFVINERETFYGVQPISAFREAIERTAAAPDPH
jgi:protein-disulfide isomerase